ncbi:MAG TPA: acyl-CoA dehydrogenase family protein [Cryptosporangiaceae bacterium]|nr:acyl-CoA dehydrogenase family protein [Cryptosporangiaceae bacterium]
MTLPGLDVLAVGEQLDEVERDLRDAVRTFTTERAMPHVADWFERGTIPRELVGELGELGVLGMHLEGYGCAGANAVSYGLACLELEAADSALRSLVSVQGSLAMYAVHRHGSEDQKRRWLPELAAGRAVGCFALTEPDAGSNPAEMRTTARRPAGSTDWLLNGTKTWITNGGIADVAVVWARTEDGLRGFLVERGAPGFSTRDIARKLSLRASVTSELSFDEVRLPGAAALPDAHGLRAPLRCLNEARYGIVWGALGAARSCLEAARDYAVSRHQFGRPIAGFQLTQQKLVDMTVEYDKGLLLALHLGRRKDAGALTPEQVSLGKLNNVREALGICREARTILGANGVTLDYPVMRHMNNLESVLTYEGTSEVHMLILGQHLTGESAFA